MNDTLSQTFSALADPTRRAMLSRLKRGEASVTELAEPFLSSMTLGGVTKHLKVLEKAGLVRKGREAQWRPCTLNPEPLKAIASWMEEYRAEMEASLDRLDEYLKTMTAAQSRDANTRKVRTRAKQSTTTKSKSIAKPNATSKRKPRNDR